MRTHLMTVLTASVLLASASGSPTAPQTAENPRGVEGRQVQPVTPDAVKSAPRPALPLADKAASELVAEKAAQSAAKAGDKQLSDVETYIIPREWFIALAPPLGSGLLEPDFFIEDDGDLVMFPNLQSGYESSNFQLSHGSWWSDFVTIPDAQAAVEVVISVPMATANEFAGHRPVTPGLRLRMNAADYQYAVTSNIFSYGNANSIPAREETRWYDFSFFPGQELWTDDIAVALDMMAFDANDSANIGWRLKDDVVVTVYF